MNGLLKPRCSLRTGQTFLRVLVSRYSTDTGSKEHIGNLITQKKVVVFMKGTADAPQCGFSNAVMQILNFHGVTDFADHNVLDDESLRQGIKDFSKWPTIPQVYMGGEFIGGCDIMLDMHKSGELIEELGKVGIKSSLLEKTKGTD